MTMQATQFSGNDIERKSTNAGYFDLLSERNRLTSTLSCSRSVLLLLIRVGKSTYGTSTPSIVALSDVPIASAYLTFQARVLTSTSTSSAILTTTFSTRSCGVNSVAA